MPSFDGAQDDISGFDGSMLYFDKAQDDISGSSNDYFY